MALRAFTFLISNNGLGNGKWEDYKTMDWAEAWALNEPKTFVYVGRANPWTTFNKLSWVDLERNYPRVNIESVDKNRISGKTGKDEATVEYTFDTHIREVSVNVLGTSPDTGIKADIQIYNHLEMKKKTVAELKKQTIFESTHFPFGTKFSSIIDKTELYREGSNRVNLYGKWVDNWSIYRSSYSIEFGPKGYIGIPNNPSLSVDYITIEALIYISDYSSSGSHKIIMNKENSYEFGITTSGILQAAIRPNWSWRGSLKVPINQWVYVACTWDGSHLKLYVDDIEESLKLNSGIITGSSNGLGIGARGIRGSGSGGDNSHFIGNMDYVRLWNIARPFSELKISKYKPFYGGENGLVGYWMMDEGDGINIMDSSIFNNNGTLFNSNWIVT